MAEYVGLDVSKEEKTYCVKDASGTILAATAFAATVIFGA